MAQIINKRTAEIIANRRPTGLMFVSVNEKGFYFPKSVSHAVGAHSGLYVHFINDVDYWAFYINDDKDGFKLVQDKGAYRVDDRALIKMFFRGIKKDCKKSRFFVVESKSAQAGVKIYEIYTKETVDVVVDKEKRLREIRRSVLNTRRTHV